MNKLVKKILRPFARNSVTWFLLDHFVLPLARYLDKDRERYIRRKNINNSLQAYFPSLNVKHGPFKGMKYPDVKSKGSALFPKLLGCYERELHQVIKHICKTKYTEVIDIGCAEGYYAVGLSLLIPDVKVYAFDIDENAIKLCNQMAKLNGIDNITTIAGACTKSSLLNLPIIKKALIICDCEGCEKKIFDSEVVNCFRHHDFLIESHDCFDIEISTYLCNIFSATHDCQVVESIDDIKKAKTYRYPEIDDYDLATKKSLIGEFRESIMEWLFFTSRA